MRGRIIPELDDARVAFERGLNDAALHSAAPPVHQTHLLKPCSGRCIDVLGDDRRNVAGHERVQIQLALDGNTDGLVRHL